MKKIIIALVLTTFSFSAAAQHLVEGAEALRRRVKEIKDIRSLDDLKNEYDGSMVMYDDWMPGVIAMKSGKEENKRMNYLYYDNSLLYVGENGEIMELKPTGTIDNVRIGDRLFEVVTYTDIKAETANTGFAEVLYKGAPMSVVKRYSIELEPGQDGSGYKEPKKPTFKESSILYYQPTSTALSYPVPSKKKEFYSIFRDKAKDVEAYAKKNKLKINEAGIISMVQYYNSLQ